jgi:tRNA(Ile)-lysidine synthase TilS/MesJ
MCKLCQTKPVYEFTNQRKLCKNCFVQYFQKKVFYSVRRFKMIQYHDVVAYKNKKDFRNVVLKKVLELFEEKSIISLVKFSSKKATKIAIASTLDSESDKIIHSLIKGKPSQLENMSPVEKKIINPLYLFLDEEILLFARIKKLKFIKSKEKKDAISKFIDNLEKKHPEIKRAIINSYLELYS